MALKILIDHTGGSRRGQRQEFDARERVGFGRHPDNDVVFDPQRDLDASARHAELRREGEDYYLIDHGSSNGTLLEGRPVSRERLARGVNHEIEFGAGGPRCRVFIGDPEVAIPATMMRRGQPAEPEAAVAEAAIPVARVAKLTRRAVEGGRSTLFLRTMMDRALHKTTLRWKLIVGGVVLACIAVLVIFLVADARRSQQSANALAGMRGELEARRKDIDRLISDRQPQEPGEVIADANNQAVYLLAFTDETGRDRPLCSAFAVTPDFLATNAHCIVQINELEGRNLTVFAVRNRTPARRYAITSIVRHPGFRGPLSTDVGLVGLDGKLEKTVVLADERRLVDLRQGTRIYVYGFPGRVADPARPEASVLDGLIGRITTFTGEPGSAADMLLVQHSAATSPGASGSPIFDARGEVVAINVGQYMELQDQQTAAGMPRMETPSGVAPGLNIAVRIDCLFPLLTERGWSPTSHQEGAK